MRLWRKWWWMAAGKITVTRMKSRRACLRERPATIACVRYYACSITHQLHDVLVTCRWCTWIGASVRELTRCKVILGQFCLKNALTRKGTIASYWVSKIGSRECRFLQQANFPPDSSTFIASLWNWETRNILKNCTCNYMFLHTFR